MSEAVDVLRSYARLVGQLTGAGSVSLYVPPAAGGEREVLVHDGGLAPLPELADAAAAAEFHRRVAGTLDQRGSARLPSAEADGVLYCVPLHWVLSHHGRSSVERRKGERPRNGDTAAWLGLRFDPGSKRPGEDPGRGPALDDEPWWRAFLALGAAFAVHTRAASRTVLDQVTGLPDRSAFQVEIEEALSEARGASRPVALVLLGPDDFGWVNERLDRRSGDRVLREIAVGLRAALRSQDHVGRYGGAIFTVVLRETSLEDGRLVAENLVRRLGDERYHQRLLRLEFSAGVASWDSAEPVDAHELIRRADQALGAAKRGQAGNVRAWEKGSDVELARSFDRLQGIFTGDKSKDYRNMTLLLDAVTVVAASTDPTELAHNFVQRLFETLHAGRAGVFERSRADGFDLLAGMERADGTARPLHVTPRDLSLLERACRERDVLTEGGGGPGEMVLCALPLYLQQRCLGGILLEVTSGDVSFAGSDRQFLEALASEMAMALDRARLTERDRERQREERERLEAEVHDLRRVLHGSRLAYGSSVMESLLATVRKVARTDTTVLITGESGTGKEMLAHTLHELSIRHERPMTVVDCSAISPTLIESELFGHEKGAFTGAHARNPGRLAQAHGATIFLDEIGDLPLDLQSKLLRFVQEKQFTPVGGVAPRTVDVRIIAATNVDLRARVAEGRFREDLFHRLNVVRLHVPPLRERQDDVLHLANVFLKQFAALYRRPAHHFTEAAENALLEYLWPGNVRELQNVILTSVLFCEGAEVDASDLQLQVPPPAAPASGRPGSADAAAPQEADPPDAPPVDRLRRALAREIAAALSPGTAAIAPLGKWLTEDLLLTADRLSGGTYRRGADLLGVPETTYRRQMRKIGARRAEGAVLRSPTWFTVASVLEDLIRSRPPDRDLCSWAEDCLLAEIETSVPGDPRKAAALMGVTEVTILRRAAQLRRF